ncbi:hypothetical protein [Marinobacter sp. ATCH36]|uniref:hypothetical protein n=1 Tax=Marinobacter sp. ATCH36 TaxID=2945106 RepID=UPI0020222682|nr:hypothetical protein [Marinobacter sp. ATCH36]MCL7943705.1 hypothetical protein [Marinobacter sp. ATCH36]
MRYRLLLQASALLLVMIMPLAQSQAAEDEGEVTVETLRQDVENLDQELNDFTAERRERLMTGIDEVLSDIDARTATLENRLKEDWDEADRLARAQAQTALASLRRERARVTEWYQRMQDSADYTWESMKEGFNDAFDQLAEAWQKAEQSVRQTDGEN